MKHTTAAVVLAAGKGTRLKATNKQNKVVYHLNQKPMVAYTVDTLKLAGIDPIVLVVGFAKESVMEALGDSVQYAVQDEPLGTGHALLCGMKGLDPQVTDLISVYGDDSAFYPVDLFETLIQAHHQHQAAVTLLTIKRDDPTGLGRIVRNKSGDIVAIVEEKNATPEQKMIKEINTGLYCFDRKYLDDALPRIKPNQITSEYYLTDIVELACKENKPVHGVCWEDETIWFGVNTPDQLKMANQLMAQRNQTSSAQ